MTTQDYFFRSLASISLLAVSAGAMASDSACEAAQLSMGDATGYMLEHNPQIDEARSALDGARADQVTASERPNPVLTFNSTAYNTRTGLGSGGIWQKKLDSVLRLDQTIERGGKRNLRLQAAAAGLDAAESDYQDLIRQLRLATANSYYDLLLAQLRVDVNRQLAELQHKTEEASALRFAAGDIAEADLIRIRVERARADSDLQRAQAELQAAQIALAHLMGCEQATKLTAASEWPNPAAESLIDDRISLEQRPDVKAARAREQRSQTLAGLAEAQRTRDVSVGLQYEHFPPDGQQLLGVGFSVPLFLFHRYDGEIARARADADAASAAARQTRADALADIEQARSALRHAAERARRAEQDFLPLSEKAAAAMDFSYTHGAVGALDLLDARRTLHAAKLEALDAQAAYAKALTAWKAAENLPQILLPSPTP